MEPPVTVVTTIPTDQVSVTAISAHWLVLALLGTALAIATGIALLVLNSPAHRTIPTIGRAIWLRDVALPPVAAACCLLIVVAVLGTSHDLKAARHGNAEPDAAAKAQSQLAEKYATTWHCHPVNSPTPTTTTVSCTLLP